MNREAALAALQVPSQTWDVIIVGGGATGLGCAVDAASRGHRTLLLERGDFASETSSRSTKLVHGGVRYLRQGNLALVREALRERARLLRNAPHCVRRLSFLLPVYGAWQKWYYRVGLSLYDRLAGDLGMDASRTLSRSESLECIPTLRSAGLSGAIRYMDGQFDDAALALSLAQTAVDQGATVLNYFPVLGVLKSQESHRLLGVSAMDAETGRTFEIQGRAVINATGIFSETLRRWDVPDAANQLTFSQGTHLVLGSEFLPGDSAVLLPKTRDGRVMFAIPWLGRTLLGTTDQVIPDAVSSPMPSASEVRFLLDHAAEILERPPRASDVLSCFAGIRPLLSRAATASTAALSREHALTVSESGLITITGGKWTTYRVMAEQTVDQAIRIAGLRSGGSLTAELPLRMSGPGNVFEPPEERGDRSVGLLHPRLTLTEDGVRHAVRGQMARRVEDVLARRSRSLFLDAASTLEIAERVTNLIAKELGRDLVWVASELQSFREYARSFQPPRS